MVNLPSGAHRTNVTIPDVGYGGSTIAFNQSKLVVQFSTNALSAIQLEVTLGDNVSFGLPAPTNITDTFYHLNASPVLGVWGNNHNGVALTISNLNVSANWPLAIVTTSAFTGGSVPAAYVQDSYYTNPSLADPYHQGMLEGGSLTIPIFNCSASATENNPIFNETRLTILRQPYWPYTEQYWKLSKVQGVPYFPDTNAPLTSTNNASICGSSVASSHFHDVATYLADADFGISPWNVHASGDLALTNGMKALGASSYNATAWKFENAQGQMIALSGPDPYPADRISYTSPLNPTKVSSADDGVPDSRTPYPVAPLVLGVTITSAIDPASITSPFHSPFTDIVGVNLVGQPGPTVCTPGVDGSGGSSNSNCWAPYAEMMQISYHDSYTIPLNDSQSFFSVNFTHYRNDLGGYQVDGQPLTLTGLLHYEPGVVYYSAPGAYLNVSAQVLPMDRVNSILSNTTEELTQLPGYGLRYTGEQEFYAFYVNLGSTAPAPFVTGTNLILESRRAFLASPASAIMANVTHQLSRSRLSCLGNATVTSRTTNSTPSETGIAGTFSIDLSSNSSCATTLLMELSARNATGVTSGQNRTLGPTQIALLGRSTQVAHVAAYLPPAGFNSDPGGGPSRVLQSIVETATTYFVSVLVAVGNFILTVAKDVVALGQLILGAIVKTLGAIAAAAQSAIATVESLLDFVVALATDLVDALFAPLSDGVKGDLLSIWAAWGTATKNYNTTGTVSPANSTALWSAILIPLVAVTLGLSAAFLAIIMIIQGFGMGTFSLAAVAVSALLSGALLGLSQYFSKSGLDPNNPLLSSPEVWASSQLVSQSKSGNGPTGSCWGLPTLATAASVGIDGYLAGTAVDELVKMFGTLEPAVLAGALPLPLIVGDALDIVGLVMDGVISYWNLNVQLAFIPVLFGVVGLVLTGLSVAIRPPAISTIVSPALWSSQRIAFALDGLNLGISVGLFYNGPC